VCKIKDLTGQKFNRLTVITDSGKRLYGIALWLCKCECGKETTVRSDHLRSGATKSCGCLHREVSSERCKNKATHEMVNIPEYGVWDAMIQRCTNPNNSAYHNYGGRGITVCDDWLNSFLNWFTYMGPRPSDDHSIDRYPDNDGNYEPGNCRWATREEQANNRRNNIFFNYNGKDYTAVQISEQFNINIGTFKGRINNRWSVKDAIETPVKVYK
jgi:hypothetical protein